MSTHTPGPYVAFHDENTNRYDVFQDNGRGFGPMLAEIVGVRGSFEANARLFAAAPDLLAACEWLLDAIGDKCRDEHMIYAKEQARAAIRKARGE